MSGYHVFSGKLYRVGLIRYVDVPAEVSRAIGEGAVHVPVVGEVEGVPLRSTLVSRGGGSYRLAIHGEIRKKLRIDTGAAVEIVLQRDEESREPALPPALVFALRNSRKAQVAFRQMTTALRWQIVRYLTSVKQQSTLERRVANFVRRLERTSPKEQKPDRSPRRNTDRENVCS